ncbi:CDP-alcohol phosphatidyltransferase family protein [Salininema proteolyticum]|uniref:CDP-alcohol phosphatidyltransferase family protein n=1 Tax=Salininema proteolyticum TaxID=1607685 RepID=A0ABV8TTX3_9ACTN
MSTGESASRRPADFYAQNRGGGLATLQNQRPAAFLAWLAWKARLKPTHLTLLSLLIGLGAAVLVIARLPAAAEGAPLWPAGIAAFLLWQLAYTLDCSDGQLARVTGTGSAAGARVDILADIAVQTGVVAAISAVAHAYADFPVWVSAAFSALWMTNLVTAVMAKEDANQSLVSSESLVVRLVKLVRDYSFILVVVGASLVFWPAGMVWVLAGFGLVNGLFLAASIAAAARAAL